MQTACQKAYAGKIIVTRYKQRTYINVKMGKLRLIFPQLGLPSLTYSINPYDISVYIFPQLGLSIPITGMVCLLGNQRIIKRIFKHSKAKTPSGVVSGGRRHTHKIYKKLASNKAQINIVCPEIKLLRFRFKYDIIYGTTDKLQTLNREILV